MPRLALLASVAVLSFTLSACTNGTPYSLDNTRQIIAQNGDYWQRTDATSAIWMQGIKAQQSLNRDIARCVTELQELVRLGEIKSIYPKDAPAPGAASSDAQKNLNTWDQPDRDGVLLTEGAGYHDFESCMVAKGWERVMFVGGDVAYKGATNYMQNHVDYEQSMQSSYKAPPKSQAQGPYKGLND
jgi:hypothetical protein